EAAPLLLGVVVVGAGAGDLLAARALQGEGETRARLRDPRLLLADLRVEEVGFQRDDGLAGPHRRPLVDVRRRDAAADERADLDVAGLDRAGEHEPVVALAQLERPERAGGDEDDDDENDDPAFHDARFRGAARAPRLQISSNVSM